MDDPGNGKRGTDNESFKNLRKKLNRNPCKGKCRFKAECRTVDDKLDYREADQLTKLTRQCDRGGLVCKNNAGDADEKCRDYEVRYFCPFETALFKAQERFKDKTCKEIAESFQADA